MKQFCYIFPRQHYLCFVIVTYIFYVIYISFFSCCFQSFVSTFNSLAITFPCMNHLECIPLKVCEASQIHRLMDCIKFGEFWLLLHQIVTLLLFPQLLFRDFFCIHIWVSSVPHRSLKLCVVLFTFLIASFLFVPNNLSAFEQNK